MEEVEVQEVKEVEVEEVEMKEVEEVEEEEAAGESPAARPSRIADGTSLPNDEAATGTPPPERQGGPREDLRRRVPPGRRGHALLGRGWRSRSWRPRSWRSRSRSRS